VRLAVAILALCAGELTAACVPPALESRDRLRKDGGPDDSGAGGDSVRPSGGTSGAPVSTGGAGAGGNGGSGAAASGGAAGMVVPVSGGGTGTGVGGGTGGSGTGGSGTGGSAKGGSGGVGDGGAGGAGGDDGTGGASFCDPQCILSGGTCCDSDCVNTALAPTHCGDCTTQCAHDEVCSNSVCLKLSCEAPALLVGDGSAPEAGSFCPPGEVCCQSQCCAADEQCCDDGRGNFSCHPGTACLPA